ncbi:DUF5677 domain-containing protein [Phyllobacterium pellucidum]|uniref:DUF5677 domain-containing protein n=1 Tax=Phyllobacterium pellucidum TaxID=2740464 RepID=UPI001D13399D|nr:DUF5677 domain-containing protein [Phyllobacterium sp. T1018]UGY08645.1 DUF5677 domain-containing protein [Phyllobacterium sp. T1018]
MNKSNNTKKAEYNKYNMAPLASLKQHKNKVLNPFAPLGNLTDPASWLDECVPNVLWAVIVVSSIERAEYLEIFKKLLQAAQRNVPKHKELYVTHNFLSVATDDEFDAIMKPVLDDKRLHKHLSVLLAIEALPDRAHWARHLELKDNAAAFNFLAGAINDVFDHQSQKSTDIRWLKLMYMLVCREQIKFAENMKHLLEEFLGYPDVGDQAKVRPAIRAMEIGLRTIEFQIEGQEKNWPDDREKMASHNSELFWQPMFRNSPCFALSQYPEGTTGPQQISEEIAETAAALSNHYMQTIGTTKADPKHEGVFGISLYALHLSLSCSSSPSHNLVDGRMALRTIMETFILLHFLVKEDNPTLWLQYRKYGAGQTKLAFLKYMKEENLPDFIDLDELHNIANEDRWMELQDIELGHWAGSNLRKMAEGAGVKDVYDKFYDWASGYVHGQWASARSTVYVNCLNPLHRFHLIPTPQLMPMPSVLPDMCKLINRMLDDVSAMYPPFKKRLVAYKGMAPEMPDDKITVVEVANKPLND